MKNSQVRFFIKDAYPEELKKFAVTMHFYSPKAYSFLRTTLRNALPEKHLVEIKNTKASLYGGANVLKIQIPGVFEITQSEQNNTYFKPLPTYELFRTSI